MSDHHEKVDYIPPHDDDKQAYDYADAAFDDEEEDSPYFEVRAAVSNKDDRDMPSMTFRVIVAGLLFTCILSFVNQMLWFRNTPILISILVVQILSYPFCKLMEWVLPRAQFSTFGWKWSFNPGPFTIKEHVLISIFANAGTGTVYAIDVVVIKRMFYHADLGFGKSLALCLTSQMIGYGLAGMARQFLVYPAAMIWPSNLANIVLFRTFHEGSRWTGLSRTQMFWAVFVAAFVWYWVPGFLFQMLSVLSVLCFFNRDSVLLAQLGDGASGMALLAFTFDWSVVTAYLGSPIVTPFWAICNIFAGFVIYIWILTPAFYYTNTWDSKRYPIYSSSTFDVYGNKYDTKRVLTPDLHLNETAYREYSPLRMTSEFALTYGVGFAGLTSILVYIFLHHGKEIWARFRDSRSEPDDVHMKLMRHYPEVPVWWYAVMYVVFAGLGIACGEAFDIQIKWYAFILCMCLPLIFLIPIGMIQAVTNQQPGLNIITELIFGYAWPGNPIGNVSFKVYGYISMTQAIALLADLKLGHYMKISPRQLFLCQSIGTLLAAVVQLGTAYFMMKNVDHVCDADWEGNQWTCPQARTFYSASIIWGLIAPQKSFNEQDYSAILHFFWIGALLPVPFYFLQKRFPNSWVRNIHVPVILAASGFLPPAPPVEYTAWFVVGFFFNYFLKRYRSMWWEKYAFATSAGLDSGTAIAGIILFFAITFNGTTLEWVGNEGVCRKAGSATFEATPAPPPAHA
ncbi:oligopeptide transporter 7-like protein [Ramicandelaber brevisporus]|nr:oligopeptide transporter 7-like protein [Ramicandelaber brevisporus]